MVMVYDTGTFLMMMIPGIKSYRTGGWSELMKAIYRDGALYFALVFLVSLINVIVILLLPEDLVHLLSAFTRTFHSILTSHTILLIRMVGAPKQLQLDLARGELHSMTRFRTTEETPSSSMFDPEAPVRAQPDRSEDDSTRPSTLVYGLAY
ncbi:hypothetical protein AAF712_016640 [Marasmius tenuissimus]|uniref:Uncharacterized protein n=1 Tax=Marasmius tenuissimus TaxID=585030 RepID=A0ABR2Z689_9AGAR